MQMLTRCKFFDVLVKRDSENRFLSGVFSTFFYISDRDFSVFSVNIFKIIRKKAKNSGNILYKK